MKLTYKLTKLLVGLFIVSFGISIMINANIGLSPWDVLHKGISDVINISMGQAIIIVSIVLTTIATIFGEKIGIGTICNTIFVGIFIDIISKSKIIPTGANFIIGFIMINVGMLIFAMGTCIYISCELGCGSKDAITILINKATKYTIKKVRCILEIIAIVIGVIMGSEFNIVTIYSAVVFGYYMQKSFDILKINPRVLDHKSINDLIKFREIA